MLLNMWRQGNLVEFFQPSVREGYRFRDSMHLRYTVTYGLLHVKSAEVGRTFYFWNGAESWRWSISSGVTSSSDRCSNLKRSVKKIASGCSKMER
ncbi:hypothetical protein AVEN_29572-1 [Araneus ventricosus]|uniref:Uncharacterized protein n=1 Tax=Araneus ventricosus TaxID=182803 RepID=A0A4Y2M406_ARAVE|nr:hypothetical protein AVEN_29572-1 [Araneus ventricosus]